MAERVARKQNGCSRVETYLLAAARVNVMKAGGAVRKTINIRWRRKLAVDPRMSLAIIS